jgi:hypothetical protein
MNIKRAVWQGAEYPSIDYVAIVKSDEGFLALGAIVGVWAGEPYHANYRIAYSLLGDVSRVSWDTGELVADAPGVWRDETGALRSEFAECRTLDIRQTPFTNTLAILYAELGTGMSLEMPVIHIDLVASELNVVRQRYTCLSWMPTGARYRFQQADYEVEFDVDVDSLVKDYPGLFQRLYP